MNEPDPQWLDAQYNNRARVAGHARFLERWASSSAQARAELPCQLDLRYGTQPGERLDLFGPRTPAAPVLVFIHGGYWRALDKSDASFVAPPFVDAGAMVVVPNYSLCPGTPERPVTVESIALQMTRALAWVYRNAALYGGSPGRIVVAGHSAGAHLAAMMACCEWPEIDPRLPMQLVQGALGISGVYDLEPISHVRFLERDLRLTPRSVERLSPVRFRRPRTARFFAAVGAQESAEFLRQNRLIRHARGPEAVPVCEEIAGANHFTVLHELADPHGPVHRMALELLGLPSH
jgi:arylformamidase